MSLRCSEISWAFKSFAAFRSFILVTAKHLLARAWRNCLMASQTKWFSSLAISFSLSSAGNKVFSRNVRALRLGSHRFFPLELSASPYWITTISWDRDWSSKEAAWWEGTRPSEWEFSVGETSTFLFLVKIEPERVSSSPVGVEVVVAGAFNFWFMESLGTMAVVLILLAISSSSFLLNLDNILSAKKSKWMVNTESKCSSHQG